jgi:hypothetical protein
LILNAHPLYPPLEQVYFSRSYFILFKRGKEFERWRSPHSFKLPSPAVNICGFFMIPAAGERIKG